MSITHPLNLKLFKNVRNWICRMRPWLFLYFIRGNLNPSNHWNIRGTLLSHRSQRKHPFPHYFKLKKKKKTLQQTKISNVQKIKHYWSPTKLRKKTISFSSFTKKKMNLTFYFFIFPLTDHSGMCGQKRKENNKQFK